MIQKLIMRLQQGTIAFLEVKKEMKMHSAFLILCKMTIKTCVYPERNLLFKAHRYASIERQFLPLIILYHDLKQCVDDKVALRICGAIIAKCGDVDIGFSLPPLQPDDDLSEFLTHLQQSKYFSISDYEVMEQDTYEVKIKVTTCGYCELLKRYNVFELAPFLCKSDEIFFSQYHPKLKFILKTSIAEGSKTCNEVYQWVEE